MKSKVATFIMGLVFFLIIGVTILFGTILWNEFFNLNQSTAEPENFQTVITSSKEKTEVIENTIDKDIKAPEIVKNPFESIKDAKQKETNKNVDYSNVSINKYFYNQLDEYSKTFYKGFEKNKENMKTGTYTVEFGNTFSELLSQSNGSEQLGRFYQSAIEAYTYDNPDVFYLSPNKMYLNVETTTRANKVTYNVYINNGKVANYLIDEFTSKSEVDSAISKVEQIRNQIQQNRKSSTYENIKMVHDYLVENIEYDRTISKGNIYNIYGAMINGEAVCEGYARSFKYLMDALRYTSYISNRKRYKLRRKNRKPRMELCSIRWKLLCNRLHMG